MIGFLDPTGRDACTLAGAVPAERPHASPRPNRSASSATAADAVRTTQYRLSSMPRLMLPASLRLWFES